MTTPAVYEGVWLPCCGLITRFDQTSTVGGGVSEEREGGEGRGREGGRGEGEGGRERERGEREEGERVQPYRPWCCTLTTCAGLCSVEPGCWGAGEGVGPRDDVLQEDVLPRSGEGRVKAEEGFNRAGEGERDLEENPTAISTYISQLPLTPWPCTYHLYHTTGFN